MELRHLRYFVTVAEELNFSKAALKLYTAQPSLSQQIKDLEVDVGVKLLNRTKRKVELTEEGAAFLEQARLILVQADKAVAIARQIAKAKQQRLRIGFVPTAEINIFPHVLPQLRIQNPELIVELTHLNECQQITALKNNELDVAFTYQNLNADHIQSQKIVDEALIFVIPETHPLAQQPVIPLHMLGYVDFLLPNEEDFPALHALILKLIQQHHLTLQLHKMDHLLLNINEMEHDNWCTILPFYAKTMLAPDLVVRALAIDLPDLSLFVNFNTQQDSMNTKKFIQRLSKVFCYE
ncbi:MULTISPECIES: LysR substrate-binding domain-containing protein [unclassified Acinetobacter]|uniref:LysR substrate-binding domain-containing protein n=1 Tax=unclassified Acinetobacter TaxID=196816 RepID=UPI00190DD3FF|nr:MULTISPECIES: LysR substrate-binding domain-containing protein [unclassified Acinetobacter]MBK0062742.1 LysR family transcriptional regulator [Acinetobacter sp. S55]MBK0065681.1 LysR family transcriptional regulator [Acinetobacter sp. S54]